MNIPTLFLAVIAATTGGTDTTQSSKSKRKKQQDDPFGLNPRNQPSSFFSPGRFDAASRASFQARKLK